MDVWRVPARPGIASFPEPLAANPYQRLLYAELERYGFRLAPGATFTLRWLWRLRREVGFAHFHWPQGHYRFGRGPLRRRSLAWLKLPLFAARLATARALGYRLVWTIHQVYPHETSGRRLDLLGARLLARSCGVLLAHDCVTAERARAELGRAAAGIAIVPHGSYIDVYPAGREPAAVRAELGVPADAFCFLCLGDLRAYKSLELMLAAFATAELPGAALVIAGTPHDAAQAAAIREAAEVDSRIRPLLGFVPDESVRELYEACDAVVLARGDGGTSGSLILALSLGRPVVAARTPAYEELLAAGSAGWLFEPGDVRSFAAALAEASSDRSAATRKGLVALEQARGLRWPEIGGRTAALLVGRQGAS